VKIMGVHADAIANGLPPNPDGDALWESFVDNSIESYAKNFSDPLQAAEQDLLGEALDACSDAKQVLRNILDDVWLRARLHEFQSAEALVVAVEAHLCALLAKTKGNK
jgi:hypothetical protein